MNLMDQTHFDRDTAMTLVGLWFTVSLLSLFLNCGCLRLAQPAFNVQRDAENILAIQKGQVARDAAPEISVGSMAHAAVGRYSGMIRSARMSIMILITVIAVVDTVRLYLTANAMDQWLKKSYGVEYDFWKLLNHDKVD